MTNISDDVMYVARYITDCIKCCAKASPDDVRGCVYDHRYNIAEDAINKLVKRGHDASRLNLLCDSIASIAYRESGHAFDSSVVDSIADSLQKIIM